MAFVMSQSTMPNSFSGGVDDDTMEISSETGHMEDFDIDIDDAATPVPVDDPMGEEVGDVDDDMDDDVDTTVEIPEQDMEDLLDDVDEELQDAETDASAASRGASADADAQEPNSGPFPDDLIHNEDILDDDQATATAERDSVTGEELGEDTALNDQAELPTAAEPASAVIGKGVDPDPPAGFTEVEEHDRSESQHAESGGAGSVDQNASQTAHADETRTVDDTNFKHEDQQQELSVDLHPCVVAWDSIEMSLFEHDNFPQFLMPDSAMAYEPLVAFLAECRTVLSESVDDKDELVIDIPQLRLRIREDTVMASTCSIADIVDIYVNLSLNDGIDVAEPLRLMLSSKTKFEARIDELREAATSGRGLSQMASMYPNNQVEADVDREQEQELQDDGDGDQDSEGKDDGKSEDQAGTTDRLENETVEEPAETAAHDSTGTSGVAANDAVDALKHIPPSLPHEADTRASHPETGVNASKDGSPQLRSHVVDEGSTTDAEAEASNTALLANTIQAAAEGDFTSDATKDDTLVNNDVGEAITGNDGENGDAEGNPDDHWADDVTQGYDDDYLEEAQDPLASNQADEYETFDDEVPQPGETDEQDTTAPGEEEEVPYLEGDSQYIDAEEGLEANEDPNTATATDTIDGAGSQQLGRASAHLTTHANVSEEPNEDRDQNGDSLGHDDQDADTTPAIEVIQRPRKRSFSEFDDLDEITDEIDTKKTRPG